MPRRFLVLAFGLALGGCNDDEPTLTLHDAAASHPMKRDAGANLSDAGVRDAAVASSHTDAAADAAVDTGAPAPPKATNVSFETAMRVEPGSRPVLQTVYSGTEVDYFAFDGEEGEFYALATDRGNFSPDNILSVYDPDRNLIAQNDSGSMWPGDSIDARLVVRLPRTGTYYVTAHDPLLAQEFFENNPLPLVFYHFSLTSLEGEVQGYARPEPDGTAQVNFLTDETTGYSYATLIGVFEPGTEASASFAGVDGKILVGEVLADGLADRSTPDMMPSEGFSPLDLLSGSGSSAHFDAVRVIGTSAHHTFAAITAAHGQNVFHPPVSDGEYRVALSAPENPLGDNPFYAVDIVLLPDNPREQAETDNDTASGAEPLELKGTAVRRRGLLLASLPEHDVDYYSFEAKDMESAVLVCEAESGGSGVRGLHVEIRDANDAVLRESDETEDKNAFIEAFHLDGAGEYYLRLSGTGVASDGGDQTEPWVRCAIVVGL